MNTFFINCPPGFEVQLANEIESFWFQLIDLDGLPTRSHFPEIKIDHGGNEFKTELHLGLQINFFTKIGLRVLLRIESFQARFFDQFEKRIESIPFEKYFSETSIHLKIESSKSRLFHETNLMESAVRAFNKRKISIDLKSDSKMQISLLIRIYNDQVVVSLDTTGAHLHFRGYRQNQGEAPIRENLASLILQLADLKSKSNYTLLDPYCGSGTFFFENQIIGVPNLKRNYSFFKFKITPALFKSPTWDKNYRIIQNRQNVSYKGYELNNETVLKLQSNIQHFKDQFQDIHISVLNENSEKVKWSDWKSEHPGPLVVVTNPPYGERSKSGSVVENIQNMESIQNLEKIIIIHPKSWSFKFSRFKSLQTIPLSNQGLDTVISLFGVNKN